MATLKFTDGNRVATFSGGTTTITAVYTGQRAELELKSRAQVAVYIDYTKGDETTVELLFEMSPDVDLPVTDPATGTDYYSFSTVDGSNNVFATEFVLNGTRKERLPIPLLHQERIMRLSLKRTGGSDGGAGTVALRVVDDSHPVTSAFTGRQP
ncbi:MAG: hypothetical protein ACXABY_10330 [Candidatus Thorarchaeota archaeon]|jgi:hypothetical protein